jgi:ubiquinone biosynthesis protein
MNVGRKIRHLKRYREIVSAFVRYGFGYIVKDLGLAQGLPYQEVWSGEGRDAQKHSIGLRIRLFLEELGPTFVKLGQLASTRADLLPAEIIAELPGCRTTCRLFRSRKSGALSNRNSGRPWKTCLRR